MDGQLQLNGEANVALEKGFIDIKEKKQKKNMFIYIYIYISFLQDTLN